jgi:hypothetical protein
MESGISKLLQSRKFWIGVMDALISLATYFVGKYFNVVSADLTLIIGALQPIALLLILTYTAEDIARAFAERATDEDIARAFAERATDEDIARVFEERKAARK